MADYSVLFVCLGNICRSPLAEGIFRDLVQKRGLSEQFLIDSCGTGAYHVGSPPHEESQRVAKQNGVSLDGQRARQVASSDFKKFSTIVAMDRQNLSDLQDLKGAKRELLVCMREFDPSPDSPDVPDPYWGGPDGFDQVFHILHRSCEQLLDHLIEGK